MNAIVILVNNFHKSTLEFGVSLKNEKYDVYFCIPNNINQNISINNLKFEDFIFMDDSIPLKDAFINSSPSVNNNSNDKINISLRDKALFYFIKKNEKNYDHLWIIEDFVFIPTNKTIRDIDNYYPNADILTNSYTIIEKEKSNLDNYKNMATKIRGDMPFIQFDPDFKFFDGEIVKISEVDKYLLFPWLKACTLAVRISKKFLSNIKEFVNINKTLLNTDFLFPTLALHNDLSLVCPVELQYIIHQKRSNEKVSNLLYWENYHIRAECLYSPVNIYDQISHRKNFNFSWY
jgi:hypothetical protein